LNYGSKTTEIYPCTIAQNTLFYNLYSLVQNPS